MLTRNGLLIFALGIILAFGSASVLAQQKVYKWVDEEGVVHFSETPPDESESVETETLTTAKPPVYVPPHPVVKSPATTDTIAEKQSFQPQAEIPPAVEQINITKMTLAELDRRCEAAREAKIAPLREAEIAKCKQQEDSDPARCERFYADYGEGGKTIYGTMRPPMFHDLPECIEDLEERRRRAN